MLVAERPAPAGRAPEPGRPSGAEGSADDVGAVLGSSPDVGATGVDTCGVDAVDRGWVEPGGVELGSAGFGAAPSAVVGTVGVCSLATF